MDHLLPGISADRVPTSRLVQQVLHPAGSVPRGGEAVLFVHGNVSSALFWQSTLLGLDAALRPLAVDLRGFGGTDPAPVDARRGVQDWSDDLFALVEALELERVHLVGWSLGGGVVLQYLRDHPSSVASLVLVAPVSPYGFGGTREPFGELVSPDGAGSGGGAVNPDFVAALAAGDATDSTPFSPRSVLRSFYVAPGSLPLSHEDVYVASMLSTRIGEDNYPGDAVASAAWPGTAPGGRGVLNTLAPTVFDVSDIASSPAKPPVLWIRGDVDQIVSDTSVFDLAYLGSLGAVPGWPGAENFPPQPMVGQTRAVLERYAAGGGTYREVVLPRVGHSPHIERPQDFLAALHQHLHNSTA